MEVYVMKLLQAIVVAWVTILCAGTTFGEVVIREVQLEWEKVAKLDGDVVFNNLCAVCHGAGGKGDGPAASALKNTAPDLTVLATNNDGVYPHKHVKNVIFGRDRDVAHGTSGMPYWGEHFMYLRPGPPVLNEVPNRNYAWERANTLSAYVETLQIN
jgi:mono/diheme cytochrome c family protein